MRPPLLWLRALLQPALARFALLALVKLSGSGAPGAPEARGAEPETDVKALLRRVDELWRGESSHALMTMTVSTERYQRTISLEA